jgi:hypothetical protein
VLLESDGRLQPSLALISLQALAVLLCSVLQQPSPAV